MNRINLARQFSLILFMLLLILGAAFAFLYQRQEQWRQATATEVAVLADEKEQLEQTLGRTENALAESERMREDVLVDAAIAQAENLLLEEDLVASQQETAALQAQADDLQAQVDDLDGMLQDANARLADFEATRAAQLAQPPTVQIIQPADNSERPFATPVEIVVVAADPAGVMTVTLTIDGVRQQLAAANEPLVTLRYRWMPPAAGVYTMSVVASNSNGQSSEPVTQTLIILELATPPDLTNP